MGGQVVEIALLEPQAQCKQPEQMPRQLEHLAIILRDPVSEARQILLPRPDIRLPRPGRTTVKLNILPIPARRVQAGFVAEVKALLRLRL